jgi:hypothetical protein
VKTAKENYTNQILQKAGKYCEIIGSSHKVKFDKNGTMRFSKAKSL